MTQAGVEEQAPPRVGEQAGDRSLGHDFSASAEPDHGAVGPDLSDHGSRLVVRRQETQPDGRQDDRHLREHNGGRGHYRAAVWIDNKYFHFLVSFICNQHLGPTWNYQFYLGMGEIPGQIF